METPPAPDGDAGVASLTKPDAISSAFWASSADATDPVRMILSATGADADVVARDRGVEQVRQAANVALPTETSMIAILRPSSRQCEDARLAIGDAGNVDALRGAHDRIGDLRVANVDFARFLGQVEDHGLANAQLQILAAGSGRAARRRRIAGVGGAEASKPGRSQDSAAAKQTPNLGRLRLRSEVMILNSVSGQRAANRGGLTGRPAARRRSERLSGRPSLSHRRRQRSGLVRRYRRGCGARDEEANSRLAGRG